LDKVCNVNTEKFEIGTKDTTTKKTMLCILDLKWLKKILWKDKTKNKAKEKYGQLDKNR
jgi:hypothetical protein